METIKNYVENMFMSLPKTEEIQKLKLDILSNMEDKYTELRNKGKSENEAIGIVISEFGNIEELLNELGINEVDTALPTVTWEEANNFINTQKIASKLIGIAVFLCIFAASIFFLIHQLNEDGYLPFKSEDTGSVLSFIPLLILIAIGVGFFIYADTKTSKYKYLDNEFELPTSVKIRLEKMYEANIPRNTISVIIGVAMCIIAPIPLFVSSSFGDNYSTYGLSFLLVIIGIGVFILIYYGSTKESLSKLLKIDSYARNKTDENKVIGAVASVVWPIAVVIFLISGLVFHQWHINWVIFPVTGVLFGMFSAVYSILKKENR